MSKFKIGDRVRVVNAKPHHSFAQVGDIGYIKEDSCVPWITFDRDLGSPFASGYGDAAYEDDLELAPEASFSDLLEAYHLAEQAMEDAEKAKEAAEDAMEDAEKAKETAVYALQIADDNLDRKFSWMKYGEDVELAPS